MRETQEKAQSSILGGNRNVRRSLGVLERQFWKSGDKPWAILLFFAPVGAVRAGTRVSAKYTVYPGT